jgi:hypothetical protein
MSLRRLAIFSALTILALASTATSEAQERVRYAKDRYYAARVQEVAASADSATTELWEAGNPWVNVGGNWYMVGLDNHYRTAYECAFAATIYDDIAQRLRYRTPQGRKAIAAVYAEYRLAQVQLNYSAAVYLYYGMLEQGHSYDRIASPYKLNVDAMYLGTYDLQ